MPPMLLLVLSWASLLQSLALSQLTMIDNPGEPQPIIITQRELEFKTFADDACKMFEEGLKHSDGTLVSASGEEVPCHR